LWSVTILADIRYISAIPGLLYADQNHDLDSAGIGTHRGSEVCGLPGQHAPFFVYGGKTNKLKPVCALSFDPLQLFLYVTLMFLPVIAFTIFCWRAAVSGSAPQYAL